MRNRIILLAIIVMISAAGITISPPSATVSAKAISAVAQATPEKALDKTAADALVTELEEGLSGLVEDETSVTAITEKWDAREDLAGKTRTQILRLLFADVKSVIEDKKTQDSVWQEWTGEEKSDEETPVASPQKPATPPVKAPEKVSTKDCPIQVGGRQSGTIKSYNQEKGYGFINSDEGGEFFFHYSSAASEGPKTFSQGQRVEFRVCISPGPKPNPRAIDVDRIQD